jgi:hypothetical protein
MTSKRPVREHDLKQRPLLICPGNPDFSPMPFHDSFGEA